MNLGRKRYAFTYASRAGSSDGAAVPWSAPSPAATRKASSGRPCCRQVTATVSSRSANRLPASLSEPKLPSRHSTAGRKARSATLFVGSTPSTPGKGPQRPPPLRQFAAQPCGFAVRILLPTSQQPPQPGPERDQPLLQLLVDHRSLQDGILCAQGGVLQPERRQLPQEEG